MERPVAKCLLEIGSITFGLDQEYYSEKGQRLPLYCDDRLILSYPRVRRSIAKWLVTKVKENYPDVEMIIGTAVNGITFALLVSLDLELPMGYILERHKVHGFKNRVEGDVQPHKKVVVVDDVVCTGETLIGVVEYLRTIECDVLGTLSIFSYELESTKKRLKDLGINNASLTNYDTVCLIGLQNGLLSYLQYQQTIKFKQEPFSDEWTKL